MYVYVCIYIYIYINTIYISRLCHNIESNHLISNMTTSVSLIDILKNVAVVVEKQKLRLGQPTKMLTLGKIQH